MDWIQFLQNIGTILIGFLAIWFKAHEIYQKYLMNIRKQAITGINQAEELYKDTTKAGGMKFQAVVSAIYKKIPDWLKPFITEERIAVIVQSTFDGMEKFANEQLDRLLKEDESQ